MLPKATFVLLLFIAAALGYLVMRDWLRPEPRAEVEAATLVPTRTITPTNVVPVWNPAEMKSSFALIRPRIETNFVRVPTNRAPVIFRTNAPAVVRVVESVPTAMPAAVAVVPPAVAVPVAFIPRGAGQPVPPVMGRAVLRGTPPPEKNIMADAVCGRLAVQPFTTRHYVVGADRGLANVFVYIKAGVPPTPASGPGPTLDQVGCEYHPYVMGVQAGQTFKVKNSDPVLHNVHALTKPGGGNKERNIAQPVKGMVTPLVFSIPEVFIKFKCDVHPWMFAYVGVVEHPWFAVTDQNGNFTLPASLPPGQYTLSATHQKAGELVVPITVTADGAEPVTFTFDVPASGAPQL